VRYALTPYNPADPEVTLLKRLFFLALLAVVVRQCRGYGLVLGWMAALALAVGMG